LVSKLLRVAVSVALLARVASRTDWEQVEAGFAGLRWEYWLAAALLLCGAQIVSAWRWKYYTDQLQLPRTLRQLTGFYFIGTYFNLLLPTSVGGDVVRAWYVGGSSSRRLAAFASVLLDRLNGLCVLVALACVAVTVSPVALPSWVVFSAWGVAAGGVLALAGLRLVVGRDDEPSKDETSKVEEPRGKIAQLRTTLRVLCRPSILPATLLLSLCVQAANVIVVWLVGQAIAAPVPAAYYWVMVPMVTLLTLLPISVGGVGVREEATVLFLTPVGIAEGTALTLSVLWFAVTAGVSLVGGAVYLFGRFPKPVAAPEEWAEGQDRTGLPARATAVAGDASAKETTDGRVRGNPDQGRTRQHRQAA
jgi:uncharacterized protein (TIRG00374 family)